MCHENSLVERINANASISIWGSQFLLSSSMCASFSFQTNLRLFSVSFHFRFSLLTKRRTASCSKSFFRNVYTISTRCTSQLKVNPFQCPFRRSVYLFSSFAFEEYCKESIFRLATAALPFLEGKATTIKTAQFCKYFPYFRSLRRSFKVTKTKCEFFWMN